MTSSRGAQRRRGIIHIIDDDAAVGDSMCALLAAHGIAAVHHPSARDFLEQAHSFDNACLVIDVHLRELDGLELVRRLRADGVSAPVILASGSVQPALLRRANQLEDVEVVAKPLDLDGFLSLLDRMQGQPGDPPKESS